MVKNHSCSRSNFFHVKCKVLLIRTDLEMTKGKVVAQACHATLHNYQMSLEKNPKVSLKCSFMMILCKGLFVRC